MEHHERYDYSPIVRRKPLRLPQGARVAVWMVPNIEHFHFDKPSVSLVEVTSGFTPDVLNYAWRDYGVRVGIWRVMEIMERNGFPGTAAINSEACQHYPQIVEAGNELGWEWMGHGTSNTVFINQLDEEEERRTIQTVVDTIAEATGTPPKGWLSPALSESFRTPDLLAECGIGYLCDWCNDDQPYLMSVRNSQLLSMPYAIELNDLTAFLRHGMTGEAFYSMIVDQFDVLYKEGTENGRVMALALHPFLSGQPHRAKYLEAALKYMAEHDDVWFARGGEIAGWYLKHAVQT